MNGGHGVTVRVDACGKTFADGTRALEPVTLDVARGETLVFFVMIIPLLIAMQVFAGWGGAQRAGR